MSRGCAFHPLSISSGRTRSRALNGELRGASRFGVRTAAITVSALIFSIPNLSIVASLDASATPGVPAIASTNSNRATAERIVLSPGMDPTTRMGLAFFSTAPNPSIELANVPGGFANNPIPSSGLPGVSNTNGAVLNDTSGSEASASGATAKATSSSGFDLGNAPRTMTPKPVATTMFGTHYSATFDGLQPGTSYRYRIIDANGSATDWFHFTTPTAINPTNTDTPTASTARTGEGSAGKASTGNKPFEFLYFGDAQEGLDKEWKVTADTAFHSTPGAQLVLHGGDMVNVHSDKEWSDFFASQGNIPGQVPTLAALGNHELMFDPNGNSFRNHFTLPENGPAQFPETTYTVDYQGVRFITLTANKQALDEQARYLDAQLSSNPHQWAVVMLYQPIYNGTLRNYTDAYRAAFGDILERHNVDLVLTGHDHTYGRGHVVDDSVRTRAGREAGTAGPEYVVASAGAKFFDTGEWIPFWDQAGAERSVWAQGIATFQKMLVDGCTLRYEAIITHVDDSSLSAKAGLTNAKSSNGVVEPGRVLDSFTINKCGGEKHVEQ